MIVFETVLNTDGTSLWTNKVVKAVKVIGLDVPYINKEVTFGELRVYFDVATWNVYTDGLIYTDDGFEAELKSVLEEAGFDASDVSYSEQGMQSKEYVSLDVGEKFLDSWVALGYAIKG